MGFLKFVICLFLAMILKAGAESDHSELLARIIADNAELKRKLAKMESERTYEAFDCYLTENWDVSGAITFTGCPGQVHYECQLTPRHISSLGGALKSISSLNKSECHVNYFSS